MLLGVAHREPAGVERQDPPELLKDRRSPIRHGRGGRGEPPELPPQFSELRFSSVHRGRPSSPRVAGHNLAVGAEAGKGSRRCRRLGREVLQVRRHRWWRENDGCATCLPEQSSSATDSDTVAVLPACRGLGELVRDAALVLGNRDGTYRHPVQYSRESSPRSFRRAQPWGRSSFPTIGCTTAPHPRHVAAR